MDKLESTVISGVSKIDWAKRPPLRPWCLDCLAGLDWIMDASGRNPPGECMGEVIECWATVYNAWWGALKPNPTPRDFANNTLKELEGAPTVYELLAIQSEISSSNYCRNVYTIKQLEQWHASYLGNQG